MSLLGPRTSELDTIAAVSTAAMEGGIGIIRLSGNRALSIADKLFRPKSGKSVSSQAGFTAQYGEVVDERGLRIDEGLALVMRAPKSYTCEDVVEISVHGGAAVLQAVLGRALSLGARPAERGEFTKRAFLAGRIDLIQAEAVLDLVRSRTELSRQWASQQLGGALSRQMQEAKSTLLDILSHLEASIDFPDDMPDTDTARILSDRLQVLSEDLGRLVRDASFGLAAKNGLRVAIVGRPNVGKSSLLNCLLRKDRAIVTPFAGTTRDVVEDEVQVGGFPLRLYDTAGIRSTEHPIEKEGIDRSKNTAAGADLILYVLDGSQPFDAEDQELLAGLGESSRIVVINKSDLPPGFDRERSTAFLGPSCIRVEISCTLKSGIDVLEDQIFRMIAGGRVMPTGSTVVTSARQKQLLGRVLEDVLEARRACHAGISPELIAVSVRASLEGIGELVGEVVTDDVLEVLFNQFCIGK